MPSASSRLNIGSRMGRNDRHSTGITSAERQAARPPRRQCSDPRAGSGKCRKKGLSVWESHRERLGICSDAGRCETLCPGGRFPRVTSRLGVVTGSGQHEYHKQQAALPGASSPGGRRLASRCARRCLDVALKLNKQRARGARTQRRAKPRRAYLAKKGAL
jgi:hypothetical protein